MLEGLLAADFAGVEVTMKVLTDKEMSSKGCKARNARSEAIIPHLETCDGNILTEAGAIASHLLNLGGAQGKQLLGQSQFA